MLYLSPKGRCISYAESIEIKKRIWVGHQVIYKGQIYTVMDVDYNGALLIDLPAQFTSETAVELHQLDGVL